jgi:hypothetical protein
MANVLLLSPRLYDPRRPLVNRDAKLMQLIQETRTPLPAKPGKPQRYEYEYERLGTANGLLCTAPLRGAYARHIRAPHRGGLGLLDQAPA